MKYQFQDCIASRVHIISRKIDAIYRKHLSHSGITANQLNFFMALYKMKNIEQNEIGNFLYLEKLSPSRNLVRLVDAGYTKSRGQSIGQLLD